MVDWNLTSSGTVNWNAAQTISNIILVLALIAVTIYYARQTAKQAKFMEMALRYQITHDFRFDAIEANKIMDFLENRQRPEEKAKEHWWQIWKRNP